MTNSSFPALVPVQHIVQSIFVLRGHKVLLDTELAELYGTPTKALNRSQSVTSSRKHRKLLSPPVSKRRPIGFTADLDEMT
jgi:hypothetical protein